MKSLYLSLALLLSLAEIGFGQGNQLDNATVQTLATHAKAVVYDRVRDLLYVTVKSSAGIPYGNSIIMVNPSTLEIVDSVFAGSEPNRIVISADCRHAYVGIDGAHAVRYFNVETKTFGPLRHLLSSFGDPAIAQSIALDPVNGRTAVVSCDDVASSATGNLMTFGQNGLLSENFYVYGPTSVAFWKSSKLVASHNYSSSVDFYRFNFDGKNLLQESNTTIGGSIEVFDDLVFQTHGAVADPESMMIVGTFGIHQYVNFFSSAPLEVSVPDKSAYFLVNHELFLFDYTNFLKRDSVALNQSLLTDSGSSLVGAGEGRLAFVDNRGVLGVISDIPFTPNPSQQLRIDTSGGSVQFDPNTRELTEGSMTTVVPSHVTDLIVNGLVGGNEHLTCVGFETVGDTVAFEVGKFRMSGRFGSFRANNFENMQFTGADDSDVAVMYDSPTAPGAVIAQEGQCVMSVSPNNLFTAIAPTVYAYGSGQSAFYGDSETITINANAKNGTVRVEGDSYSFQNKGFMINFVAGGSGGLNGVLVDSAANDTVTAKHKFTRLLNDNVDYRFKSTGPFSLTANAISGGTDRVIFYRPATSTIFQSPGVATMTGVDSRTSARQFETVRIINE